MQERGLLRPDGLRLILEFKPHCPHALLNTSPTYPALPPSGLKEGEQGARSGVGEGKALVVCYTLGCQSWLSGRPPWSANVWQECSGLSKNRSFWTPEGSPPRLLEGWQGDPFGGVFCLCAVHRAAACAACAAKRRETLLFPSPRGGQAGDPGAQCRENGGFATPGPVGHGVCTCRTRMGGRRARQRATGGQRDDPSERNSSLCRAGPTSGRCRGSGGGDPLTLQPLPRHKSDLDLDRLLPSLIPPLPSPSH